MTQQDPALDQVLKRSVRRLLDLGYHKALGQAKAAYVDPMPRPAWDPALEAEGYDRLVLVDLRVPLTGHFGHRERLDRSIVNGAKRCWLVVSCRTLPSLDRQDPCTTGRWPLRSWRPRGPGVRVVGEAADGEEGLHLARTLPPDLVLMDITMPRLDGLRATRRLKAERPEAAVIIMTVHRDEACRRAGKC